MAKALGAALGAAAVSGQRLALRDLPGLAALRTLDDAYTAQASVLRTLALAEQSVEGGGALAGWKLGATNAAAQARLRLDAPFYGPVTRANLALSGATVSLSGAPFRLRGVEAELAFIMRGGLPEAQRTAYTRAQVEDAVDSVLPAIEICGSRLLEPPPSPPSPPTGGGGADPPLSTLLSIADLASHGALVRGVELALPLAEWRQLTRGGWAALPVRMLVNGVEVAAGSGADVLGDPLNALTWLANALRAAGRGGLRAGDVVTSGTMTGLAPVKAGDVVVAEFRGLGDVHCAFVE